jgi:heme/copper-type cytochrome/quinol oxidase subunit 2
MRALFPFLTRFFSKADEVDWFFVLLPVGIVVIILVIIVTIIVIRSLRNIDEKNKKYIPSIHHIKK